MPTDDEKQDAALWVAVKAEVNRIMELSEPELRAEYEAKGLNYSEEAAKAKASLDRALADAFAAEARRKARLKRSGMG